MQGQQSEMAGMEAAAIEQPPAAAAELEVEAPRPVEVAVESEAIEVAVESEATEVAVELGAAEVPAAKEAVELVAPAEAAVKAVVELVPPAEAAAKAVVELVPPAEGAEKAVVEHAPPAEAAVKAVVETLLPAEAAGKEVVVHALPAGVAAKTVVELAPPTVVAAKAVVEHAPPAGAAAKAGVKPGPPADMVLSALMEVLADPKLPLSTRPPSPSPSDRQDVAKQMRAVAMLYNYYHRKDYPEVEFLDYKAFCKEAVMVRPVLSTHMALTSLSAEDLTDWQKQPSLTEKAIMDACNVASYLEAHGDDKNVQKWPLEKAAVLLVDSKKETCALPFGNVTNGSWCPLEVHIDDTNAKRFEHFAFGAIQKAEGIHMSKLKVLEKHVVYSLSKEKAAAIFFIMLCTDPSKTFEVPIKDIVASMEGPLFTDSWCLSSMVEYYDTLPYARIISRWYSRRNGSNGSELPSSSFEEGILNDLENSPVSLGNMDGNSSLVLEDRSNGDRRQFSDINDQRTNNSSSTVNGALIYDKPTRGKKDNQEIRRPKPKRKLKQRELTLEDLEKAREMRNTDLRESLDIAQAAEAAEGNIETGAKRKVTFGKVTYRGLETEVHGSAKKKQKVSDLSDSDRAWDSNDSEQYSPNDLHRINCLTRQTPTMDFNSMLNRLTTDSDMDTCVYCHLKQKIPSGSGSVTTVPGAATQGGETVLASVLAKKNLALTKVSLGVLYSKREKLVQQRRILDREIAQCDQKIHNILDGKEESLGDKLDAVINGCKDMLQMDMAG